jgi:hypothetical protein|tara:strand:+ start:457 stop:1380 length:924 start_codon:yes stop_codon:yes gene_type:complete
MASTYTSRIRLTKQGDGDNPNSWGTVLNNGVVSLVDDAIAAYTTVSIGSAATVTLSAVDGGSDTARSAFLEVKGSVGGTYTTITFLAPSNSKSYVVNNRVSANTTASDIVKIKTAGGTGYDIPFGAVGLIINDGTSIWATNAKGLGFGTAASADIGVCATNIADVSLADLRYVRTSVTTDATIRGNITYEAGSLKVGTSARAYSPFVTVTDAACVSVNFALGNTFVVTLAGNRTLKAPANCTAGQSGSIHVIQDGTGSRTLAYNTAWQFVSGTAPTLSTGVNDVDILCYIARSATTVDTVLLKNFDR